MKNIFIIFFIATAITNFAFADTIKIWPDHNLFGPDIRSVKPLVGFIVTPAEVRKMYAPQKYVVEIYADEHYYYIIKSGASPKMAEEYGIKINGKTGAIIYPVAKNEYSVKCKLRGYSKTKQKQ
jgi:hypothetical protein